MTKTPKPQPAQGDDAAAKQPLSLDMLEQVRAGATVTGTDHDDVLTVTPDDLNNRMQGGGGNDRLIGNDQRDVLFGGSFDDLGARRPATSGDDVMTGGGGDDAFLYSPVQGGHDRITDFTPGTDQISIHGWSWDRIAPLMREHDGGTLIRFDDNNTLFIENVRPAQLARDDFGEKIEGKTINGTHGNDTLVGTAGNDEIDGAMAGSIAASGSDVLTGGDGRDVFGYTDGHDRITDFSPGNDRIKLIAVQSWEELRPLLKAHQGGTLIEFSFGSLFLEKVAPAQLSARDFEFVELDTYTRVWERIINQPRR